MKEMQTTQLKEWTARKLMGVGLLLKCLVQEELGEEMAVVEEMAVEGSTVVEEMVVEDITAAVGTEEEVAETETEDLEEEEEETLLTDALTVVGLVIGPVIAKNLAAEEKGALIAGILDILLEIAVKNSV